MKTSDLETKVSLKQILDSNGIRDAIWALRCFDYKEYCLFLADVAESVYHIYKLYNKKDTAVWNCIQAVHYFYNGFITLKQLKSAADAADAADTAAAAAADADAADAAYTAAYAAAYAADSRKGKWMEITELFKKHFCDEKNQ